MKLEEFQDLAETWGGDIARWPEGTREQAQRIAATDDGKSILDRERALDVVASERPSISRERAQSSSHAVILQLATEEERKQAAARRWRLPDWFLPSASLACSAALGVALAFSVPLDAGEDQNVVLSALFDSGSMAAGLVMR